MEMRIITTTKRTGILLSVKHYTVILLCCLSIGLSAQTPLRITGLITEGDGNPLIGVSVTVKNTTQGTFTDENGRYTISASPGSVLVFSYIGFVTEERTIKDETAINIRMLTSSADLSEVVVVGYGQQKKESLVSSI